MVSSRRPDAYEAEIVPAAGGSNPAACLRAVRVVEEEFGTLTQMVAADDYKSKRLRFSASMRGQDVREWSGLWMRVDGPAGQLAFDNMEDRPLRGTFEWAPAEVVLDVPPESQVIAFGVVLVGLGARSG